MTIAHVLAETQQGTRLIDGVAHPVLLRVYRLAGRYVVARIVCGRPEFGRSHPDLYRALLDYEFRKLGVTQRAAEA